LLSSAVRGAQRRVADAGWSVVQTPVAAGLAWYIAHTLLGHHQAFFAPTAAAVSLSKARVLRGQRALQLMVGVVLGIGAGTAVKAVAGPSEGASGAVALAVAALIAFVAALVLGGGFFEQGVLFVNQSVGSAILMRQLAELQQVRSTARQVTTLAPRRWPERSQVRRAGEQTEPLNLLAATVLSLAHASTIGSADQQPHPRALGEALGELTSAFAALAEGGGDANAAEAARHAFRA
jgi:uncharacterized membrane protein YgaE (UPF0421/DUF939 family)